MSSQKNVLEVILSSSRSVFNIQSLRMLMKCENSQKLTQSLHYYIKEGKISARAIREVPPLLIKK